MSSANENISQAEGIGEIHERDDTETRKDETKRKFKEAVIKMKSVQIFDWKRPGSQIVFFRGFRYHRDTRHRVSQGLSIKIRLLCKLKMVTEQFHVTSTLELKSSTQKKAQA